MKKSTEELLPVELIEKSIKSGEEFGWRFDDVPKVVEACKKQRFALLGGQVRFIFPDATCDLYWINADPKEKNQEESWINYVNRSCLELLEIYQNKVLMINMEKEAIEGFSYLRDKVDRGINIINHMWFIMYPINEEEFIQLQKRKARRVK